jgi:hypothetical protein
MGTQFVALGINLFGLFDRLSRLKHFKFGDCLATQWFIKYEITQG